MSDIDIDAETQYYQDEQQRVSDKGDSKPKQQTQALTVREAVGALEKAPIPEKPQVTAAQAKIEAVASLTQAAYAKAATLALTPEESAALQADFPDEAFRTGAGGKEELIYLEHFALRERLNKVLGLGQWAIVPRSRWAEDFEYYDKFSKTNQKASRVYTEVMLVIRGCFVAESIGDMVFYPKNQSTNYGDAVEGAQSEALRRCCKNFGIGLQAWSKAFQEGWWQRKRASQRPPAQTQPASKPAPPAAAKPQAPAAPRKDDPAVPEMFPVVTVKTVKEVHSKPDAPKKWTAYFISFDDGFAGVEAATFDAKVADLANELANTGENAALTTRPGRKLGTREIVSLARNDAPPEPQQPQGGDLPWTDDQPAGVMP